MSEARARIAELERQVALLQTQLGTMDQLEDSVERKLRALLGDRLVLDALPGVVSVLDAQHRVVYLNRAIAGRDVREFYGTDARATVAEPDRERYSRVFEQAFREGTPRSLRLRTLSGRHWETTFIPVKDGGQAVFMLVTSSDVTDRFAADSALRESEERLRHALDASGMGTWTYVVAEDQVTWDDTTSALFGIPPEEAPKNIEEYLSKIHPDDRQQTARTVQRSMERGKYEDLEHRVLLPTGEVRHLLAKGAILLDEDGNTVGVRGGVFDITTRKELESQLQLAQKMQAVGQLTSGIAHNLNNALAVIIPNIEECRSVATGELLEQVEDMAHAAQRAAEMVRQLMLFVRPDVGAKKRTFDIIQTVRRTMEMCRKTFDRRIAIDVDASGVVPIAGNEGQLEQVLLNVCLNARDALMGSSVETPLISVSVRQPSSESVILTVVDNGPGMSEEVRRRVFEPFFTTKEVGRGTGLGMASAYAIIDDHGGIIRCRSSLGQGTTFELELPATTSSDSMPRVQPARTEPATGKERVLVVDDEPAVRRSLVSVLQRAGYVVEQCRSGPETCERLEAEGPKPDIIVLDRSMPGMSGEQVVQRIRQCGIEIPVVILTGDPAPYDQQSDVQLVLNKPVNRHALLKSLRSLLDENP